MKIAQIAPVWERVPAKKYGGTERVIYALTEALVKLGHDVTLFASGDSITSAKLDSVSSIPLRELTTKGGCPVTHPLNLLHVANAYNKADSFDIIHDHNSQNNPVSLPLANISKTPVVMTLHGPLDGDYGFETDGPGYKMYELYKRSHLVSISRKQQLVAPHLNFAGNVYHGLPMQHYPFSKEDGGYLLFVGRVHLYNGVEEKGLRTAIAIARFLGLPLLIAAKVDKNNEQDMAYFRSVIEPQLSDKIQFLGEIDETKRNELMSRAICLLHPINFEEPFGLALIEAMACGCPVVALNKGSIPEIIVHGRTGFVANSLEEIANYVKQIGTISRADCRMHALENFSDQKMASYYESIYHQVLMRTSYRNFKDQIVYRLSHSIGQNFTPRSAPSGPFASN